MSKTIELNINKVFGGLKLLGRSEKKEKRIFAKCLCIHCNKIAHVELWNLIGEHYKSCGCLKYALNTKSPRWKGFGEISQTHFNRLKNGAKKRNLDFDLNIEDIWNLFLNQNRKCAISGLELRFPNSRIDYKSTASLDRIDPKKHYTNDNIQWLHVDVNYAKQSMNNSEFLNLIKQIYSFQYE